VTAKKTADVVIRPKRQVTIPKEVCEQLGLKTGDMLEMMVEGSMIIARPRKNIALESLKEIQQAFQRSGITEEKLIRERGRARQASVRERFSAEE
jgi:AbrB family looped-hinge helix DNA binding protein